MPRRHQLARAGIEGEEGLAVAGIDAHLEVLLELPPCWSEEVCQVFTDCRGMKRLRPDGEEEGESCAPTRPRSMNRAPFASRRRECGSCAFMQKKRKGSSRSSEASTWKVTNRRLFQAEMIEVTVTQMTQKHATTKRIDA